MRIIVFILTLVCFFNLTANSVYIDTVYCNYYNNLVKQKQLIVNYKLKNISDEDYLTWVSITPVEKKSDRELVYEFFKQRKGDFSWLQMMYEGLLETQIMNVGYSFIKNIHPNETFSYYVCKIDKKSFFYEDRIVIIQKKKVEQYLKEKFDDKYFFQLPYIVLIDGKIESNILTDNGYAVPDAMTGGYEYYYYVKDWQGNVRAVIDEANRRMELNNYYPYGMPMSSTVSVQPYKYGGKELDRTNGLDMYDYGARWYDMIVPHFITIDPMAEKNCSVSPYSYCGGNPINSVDPTGMDEWEINKRGEIVNRIKTTEHDAFYIVNKNKDGIYEREYSVDNEGNKKYNSISFKYGTIESQRSISYNKSDSYDIYQVRGDDTGEKLFTFLSDNVSVKPGQVEFTLTQSGIKGSSGLNFITTGHMRGSEPGFKYLFEGQLVNGYILRNIIHSHPVGKNAGRNDVIQIGNIRDNLQPRGLPMPLFFIYHVPTKSYKQYND